LSTGLKHKFSGNIFDFGILKQITNSNKNYRLLDSNKKQLI